MISKTVLHYNILEIIGEGGMGIVYKARDLNLDRLVALKFLHSYSTVNEERTNQFLHEARTAAQLDHPNICTIHEIGQNDDNQLFIVMPLCHGQTLKQLLRERAQLPLEQFLNISIQIGQGLSSAHTAGIFHRDIKSANIIVNEDEFVKILDFGLALLKEDSQQHDGSSTAGTIAYMSPEQALGLPVGQKSDIWSMGVVMYEMLCGRLPFEYKNDQQTIYAIIKNDPEDVSKLRDNLPVTLIKILEKTLQKDPEERFPSAEDLVIKLQEIQQIDSPVKRQVNAKTKKYLSSAAAFLLILLIASYSYFQHTFFVESKTRIAVLPFKNLSMDTTQEFFSDGLTHEIIAQLSKINQFNILPLQSVIKYKNSQSRLEAIGEELNVTYLLEASVQREGDRVGIVIQLYQAEDEERIWGESFDREFTDIFKIRAEIAQNIALALQTKLTQKQVREIEETPTKNLTAYDFYLKGLSYTYKTGPENQLYAIRLFKRAIEIDPQFAQAYAGLADALAPNAGQFGFSKVHSDSIKDLINISLSLDPTCSEAYFALGRLYEYTELGKFPEAGEAYAKALEFDPNNRRALNGLAHIMNETAKYEEAINLIQKSLEIDPGSSYARCLMGKSYTAIGEYAKAEESFKTAQELAPDYAYAFQMLGELYMLQGKYDQAIPQFSQGIRFNPNAVWLYHRRAFANNSVGRNEEAIKDLKMGIMVSPVSGIQRPTQYVGLARIYTQVENFNLAGKTYLEAISAHPCNIHLQLDYSYFLSYIGQKKAAREMLENFLYHSNCELDMVGRVLTQFAEFYLGNISEHALKQIIEQAFEKLPIPSAYHAHYYFLGMAHLLNLGTKDGISLADTAKAIYNFKKYAGKSFQNTQAGPFVKKLLKELQDET